MEQTVQHEMESEVIQGFLGITTILMVQNVLYNDGVGYLKWISA